MSEYIYPMSAIREAFGDSPFNEVEEFDRSLARYEREVATKAWERGFAMRGLFEANKYHMTGTDYSINPYKESE